MLRSSYWRPSWPLMDKIGVKMDMNNGKAEYISLDPKRPEDEKWLKQIKEEEEMFQPLFLRSYGDKSIRRLTTTVREEFRSQERDDLRKMKPGNFYLFFSSSHTNFN